MEREEIKNCLYEKYIRPTEAERDLYVGVEIEMPIINLSGCATDFKAAQAAFCSFVKQYGFSEEAFDDNGVCYSASNEKNCDNISFDCSYNNMELSLGRAERIQELDARFCEYTAFLNRQLGKSGHIITGMGINPNHNVNRKDYIPSERYRMLEHYLLNSNKWEIPKYFHKYPDFGTFASASQVQLDVRREDLTTALKGFSLVEPIKSVLFNNSVILSEKDLLCARDGLWENSTHGINPHNVGMYDCELQSIDDLLEYICTTSIFCTERDGRYIHFKPVLITDYLKADKIEGEYYSGGKYIPVAFKPKKEDIKYLRTYKFEDLTFRGTIEFRSVCCQPFKDAMTVAAFHTGLIIKSKELAALLENDRTLYHHGYSAAELRKLMNREALPGYVDKNELRKLCFSVLGLAGDGLRERGYGEEKYLVPLYERAETLCSPAKKMLNKLREGVPMERIIKEYAG